MTKKSNESLEKRKAYVVSNYYKMIQKGMSREVAVKKLADKLFLSTQTIYIILAS